MKTDIQLSPHFHLREFLHNGNSEGVTADIVENLRSLSQALEKARALIGKPLIITSGFRTVQHNKEIGGAPNSQHLYGKAADIVVSGMTPDQIRDAVGDWSGGLGHYPDKPNRKGWIHLDIGPKRRWEG